MYSFITLLPYYMQPSDTSYGIHTPVFPSLTDGKITTSVFFSIRKVNGYYIYTESDCNYFLTGFLNQGVKEKSKEIQQQNRHILVFKALGLI